MAQRKPEEQTTFDQVLKLVEHLSPEAQEQLVEEMKLQWLRRALDQAEESVRLNGTRAVEEVMAELRRRADERLRKFGQ